jgi:hypothetical protein
MCVCVYVCVCSVRWQYADRWQTGKLALLATWGQKRKGKTDKHIRQVNKNRKTCPTCNSVINEEDGEGGKIWGDNKGASGFVDSVISV